MSTVSFIIPHWNRRDLLAAVLESIRAQTCPLPEVLVVDNGSTDGSQQVAEQAGAKILQLDTNQGFSFAVNRGIEAARGDRIGILNNDVELEPAWTAKLLEGLERSTAWFAIGKLLDHTDRRIDGVGDAICAGGTSCRLGHGHTDQAPFDTSRETFFPSGTAVLFRRAFFDSAGMFDEAFFAYLEDVDLGLRAALLGLHGVYVPAALAYHRASATLGAWNPRVVAWTTRNQILLLAKFYPQRVLRRFWRPILVAQALWAARLLLRGRPLAYVRGMVAGLAAAPALRRATVNWRDSGNRLASVLLQSQAELFEMQRAAGWDPYWRWYFRLIPHTPSHCDPEVGEASSR